MSMNKLSHVCGLILLVLLTSVGLSSTLVAQDEVVIYVESVEASINDEIAVNIAVENFTNIAGLQISLQWDMSKLEYIGVENLAFDATPQSSLNVSQIAEGRLGFFIADMTLEGYDLDDGATLLTIRYNAVGPDNSIYDIMFVDEPVSRVVADTMNNPLPVIYTDGTVTVGTPNSITSNTATDTRVQVSPNPFQNKAQIVVEDLGSGPATLNVFDVEGRLVVNRSIELDGQLQMFTINADDLNSPGVYLLQISTNRGKYSRKLIFRGNGR